jgi:hypothetical protein
MRIRGLTRREYNLAEEVWERVTSRGEFGSRRLGYGFEPEHLIAITDALHRYRNATRLARFLTRVLDAPHAPSLGDLIFQYPTLVAELETQPHSESRRTFSTATRTLVTEARSRLGKWAP